MNIKRGETAMSDPVESMDLRPEYITPEADEVGRTALHYAAYRNDPEWVREEIANGLPVDSLDAGGWTPLHWAIDMAQAWGEPEQVVAMLEAGASPNSADTSGVSVLMKACDRRSLEIVDLLLAAGADPHYRNVDTTPLHVAAECDFVDAIRRLLALGVDAQQLNGLGETAEQTAERCEWPASVAVLRQVRRQEVT